ncbi:MAG: hypothetical protein IJ416_09350 [Ruminiclostridium sp.]|nr:hypothetical protein [Ruminiclostridium sp.]
MRRGKITALMLSIVLLLSGCGDSPEQKAENEKILRQAESNAVDYIEKKYGFTPAVIESTLERSQGLFGSTPLTSALVRMSYNGHDFSVYIDGVTKNTDGADNYQQDEIISALTDKINEIVPQLESLRVRGGEGLGVYPNFYNCDREYFNNLYPVYFDGSNFSEVLGGNLCSITADYINADFPELTESDFVFLPFGKQFGFDLVSYRSDEDYLNRPDYSEINDFTGIKKHAVLIEESFSFGKDGYEHNEYVLGKHDDFYYYISDNMPDVVSFTDGSMPDASEFDGNGIIGGEFVTPAYSINSSVNERLYIYYPLSELPEKSRLATYIKTDDGADLDISPLAYDIGDYRMVYIQASEFEDAYFDGDAKISFAFITEKENISNEQ